MGSEAVPSESRTTRFVFLFFFFNRYSVVGLFG